MNREIIFKAKRKDNGEWVEGCLIIDYVSGQYFIHQNGNSVNESPKIGEEGCLRFLAFEIDPDTICQYTGITDKNDQKIWENDIVTITLECDDYLIPSETGIVEYSYGQHELKVKAPDGQEAYSNLINKLSESPFEIEKLGNFFDNPELLEVD